MEDDVEEPEEEESSTEEETTTEEESSAEESTEDIDWVDPLPDDDEKDPVGDIYVDIDLSGVEDKLDYSNKLQEAGNTLVGYILQSVDGTNEYLATIVDNTHVTNVLLNDIKQ